MNSNLPANLPLCELHVHIEGTLEPELRYALAARNNLDLGFQSLADLKASYDYADLSSFLKVYYQGMEVLLTEPDFYDLAMHYFTKVAEQRLIYVELFFDPQAHTSRGVPFDIVIRGLRRAQQKAKETLNIDSSLIMCFLRDFQAEFAMATLLESLPYREWIVGVGLDSDEKNNPPLKFKQVFERARREGYRITMHCDVDQQNSIEHIRQCLTEIKVDRLDHGTNVLEDEKLVDILLQQGIGLTCCPISNSWIANSTKGDLIVKLLKRGVKVTLNSDDPAYFRGYVKDNFALIAQEQQLTKQQIIQLAHNAIEISWASPEVKARFLAELAQVS